MAKIQRLKISTDEKMSMLRGQPGHMPAAPVAAEPIAPVAPAPTPEPAPEPAAVATPPVAAAPVQAEKPVAAPKAVAPRPAAPVATAPKKGRGRPPKAAAPEVAEGAAAGLQPSLIRLEGETQRAALAYIHEELMHHSRRVYLKELVDEAVNYYLQHGPPKASRGGVGL
jgi:outer membrane biosynthesis protein TonB